LLMSLYGGGAMRSKRTLKPSTESAHLSTSFASLPISRHLYSDWANSVGPLLIKTEINKFTIPSDYDSPAQWHICQILDMTTF
jgi:hypothetical protein